MMSEINYLEEYKRWSENAVEDKDIAEELAGISGDDKVVFINLFEVVKVVWTFWIDAFMDDEVLTVLFGNKDVVAVRTT